MSKEPELIESGEHLGIVRSFIQRHALNGSEVTWGSHDLLRLTDVTVYDMEMLAQRIANASRKDSGV